ncbi:hypothetical protein I79_000625 [Cricetulus griseus]|uniref:Uncharacterized protein n=1 Tax=Cricetulus griseus TaxID=10029 RepID=G3GSK9_CRIGR|nr:hypothetical protein I79_000625 [Cricetulus griseus]
MLPKVESRYAEFHLGFSHLHIRKSLFSSLPHKDTEGTRENTQSAGVVGEKAAERRASVLFHLQL